MKTQCIEKKANSIVRWQLNVKGDTYNENSHFGVLQFLWMVLVLLL